MSSDLWVCQLATHVYIGHDRQVEGSCYLNRTSSFLHNIDSQYIETIDDK